MQNDLLKKIRNERPLIHCITNHVTVNAVVNMLLAAGAAAVCADDINEVEEITSVSKGLLLNTGTPSEQRTETMIRAGITANRTGIPVILDPAGLGASLFRKRIVQDILSSVRISCIRGNNTEIAVLAGKDIASKGVESAGVSLTDAELMSAAGKYRTVIAATGKTDRIASAEEVVSITGGTEMLRNITGSGCMLSGLITAFISAAGNEHEFFTAAETAVKTYSRAAENAECFIRKKGHAGTASFEAALRDEISIMS